MIQTATETIGNGDKGSVLVKCTDIYLLVSLTCFVFFGFNTARKAAWLTQLECASDREDPQMLPASASQKHRADCGNSDLRLFSSDACFVTYVCSIRVNERVYVF